VDPESILAAIEEQQSADAEPRVDQERVSYLGFCLGAEVYGLPLDRLREVARVSHVRRVPGSPPGVAGLVNLRGEIL
jgi:chemotaxis signal transduction protein